MFEILPSVKSVGQSKQRIAVGKPCASAKASAARGWRPMGGVSAMSAEARLPTRQALF